MLKIAHSHIIYEDALEVLQNAAIGIHFIDADATILWANKTQLNMLGYTSDEYIGHNIKEFHRQATALDDIFKQLNDHQILNNYEVQFRCKDGSFKLVQLTSSVYWKEGKFMHSRCFMQDITALRTQQLQAEEGRLLALQEAHTQARKRAEEAEAHRRQQAEFMDTLCHELRNPLQGLIGGLDILDQTATKQAQLLQQVRQQVPPLVDIQLQSHMATIKQTLGSMNQCIEQQKVIVNDVLDLSKLEAKTIELNAIPFNPKQLIEKLLQMFMPMITKKQLKLALFLSEAEEWVKGDPYRVNQIITNLVSNAIKFTHQGSITLSAHLQSSSQLNTTELKITVEDTGIGMNKEELGQLFLRFQQANPKISAEYGGSGLGLTICKKLVELMSGTIKVKSEKWQGTKISFTISCHLLSEQEKMDIKQTKEKISPALSFEATLGEKIILIVEDNSVNQKVLTHYLAQVKCAYQLASNGVEAVEKFQHGKFDGILMDIEMPLMNGLDATRQIRAWEKQQGLNPIPILGLSGNSRQEQIEEALQAGMTDYLTKPVHKNILYQKLALLMGNTSKQEQNIEEPVHSKKLKREGGSQPEFFSTVKTSEAKDLNHDNKTVTPVNNNNKL